MNELIVVRTRAVVFGGGTKTIGNTARTRCLVGLDFSCRSPLVSSAMGLRLVVQLFPATSGLNVVLLRCA
jgi:hypothetical protein